MNTSGELSKHYTGFGGCDFSVLMDHEKVSTLLAISFDTSGPEPRVQIINLCLDTFGALAKNYSTLVMIAATEYGERTIPLCLEGLELLSVKGEVTVDDMAVEEIYIYRFKKFVPGVVLNKEGEENPTVLRYKQEGYSSIQEAIAMSLIRNENNCIKMLLEFVPEMVDRFPEWKTLVHGGVE